MHCSKVGESGRVSEPLGPLEPLGAFLWSSGPLVLWSRRYLLAVSHSRQTEESSGSQDVQCWSVHGSGDCIPHTSHTP